MDYSLSEQQEMLKNTARDFLEKESPKSHVREMEKDDKGYSPELWKKMADLGWMGLVFPEELGGSGMGPLELTVLLEEMGRALVPAPFPRRSSPPWSAAASRSCDGAAKSRRRRCCRR